LYWQKLLAQKQAGEVEETRKTGMALVNLFPQAPQRGAALLKLAELAQGKGDPAQALELYGLAASLFPGTPEAAQAALEAHVLELSRDLSQGKALPALRHFLKKVTTLPSGYPPETLQAALKTGWQAVCQQVRAADPPPLTLVEEILTLWDLQPQSNGPPDAARLLADLLQEYGLLEEARTLLAREGAKTENDRRSGLQVHGLELAWLSKGWPGVADFLKQIPEGEKKQNFLLRSFLSRWQSGAESAAPPVETLLSWFTPQKPNAWETGELAALEQSLKQPWTAPFAERLQASLARRYWTEGQFSHAAQMYQSMADHSLEGDLSPFYQDRLGLSHFKCGKTDAAQKTFRKLAQHDDTFWRRLAQVRLTDLELSRVQAEPSP